MSMADLRTTIFVGNLSVFCSEQDLEQVFSRYGTILEIRMAKSEDKSKHLSYGFVKFASVASAQLAMLELDGKILCGRPLKIGKALSRSNRKVGGKGMSNQQYDTASVHVTFISNQTSSLINEESLRNLFSQFGEVVDAVICKSHVDQRTNRQSGYGFIHFPGTPEGLNASFRAAQALMDIMIDDVNYKCKISHQLEQQLIKTSTDEVELEPHQVEYGGRIDQLSPSSLPPPPSVPAIQIPSYNYNVTGQRYHPSPPNPSPPNAYGNLGQSIPTPANRANMEYSSQLVHGLSRTNSAPGLVANTPRTPYASYSNLPYTPNNYHQPMNNNPRIMPLTKKTSSIYSMTDLSSNLSSLSMDNTIYPANQTLSISNAPTPIAKDSLRGVNSVYGMRDGFGGLMNSSQANNSSMHTSGGFALGSSLNLSLNPSSVGNDQPYFHEDEKTVRY
eukprot:gene5753-6187_t